MKIAVQGCCHGQLDTIYAQIERLEQTNGYKVDCLIICGDFQAIRNHQDLQCMSVPAKFRHLGGFYRYYTGEKEAPILTIVIGGNHEASNYMWELYHGGWLAPKIYFMGFAGCVQLNGVKIAGMSGIYSSHHYRTGHYETMPYNGNTMRSIYHIREYDVFRLSHLTGVDVFLSHDWPVGITAHGDVAGLLRRKPFFRADIEKGALGSPPAMDLLLRLKPKWWFSAHLHCRFEASVVHDPGDGNLDNSSATEQPSQGQARGDNPDEIIIDDDLDMPGEVSSTTSASVPAPASSLNPGPGLTPIASTSRGPPSDSEARPSPSLMNPDEIVLEDEIEEVAPPPRMPEVTRFLALDKCLPQRQYLEVIDIPSPMDTSLPLPETPKLQFDPEWLAITRAFHAQLSTTHAQARFPNARRAAEMITREAEWVRTHLMRMGNSSSSSADEVEGKGGPDEMPMVVGGVSNGKFDPSRLRDVDECQVFWPTAPGPGSEGEHKFSQPPWYTNPQTEAFCGMLELENKVNPVPKELRRAQAQAGGDSDKADDHQHELDGKKVEEGVPGTIDVSAVGQEGG